MRSRFIAVILLASMGTWLLIAGAAALLTGSYRLTGGATGPWAGLVASVGLDPAGWVVGLAHVGTGVVALLAAFAVAAGWGALAWWLGVTAGSFLLWYLPVGTIAGAATLIVLALPGPRMAIRGE